MSYVLWDIVTHVVCIVGYSNTCNMYCGIQLYMSYVLWDTVIHVICIVGYSYTCRMHCGVQLYILYILQGIPLYM